MWRAFFLAIGIFTAILGAEALVVDKAVLTIRQQPATGLSAALDIDGAGRPREITPPEWAPWSLLSVGAVTILYSFTIPKRVKE